MSTLKRKPQPKSLRAWRERRKLTMREAAEAVGYSIPGYYKLESGQHHPQKPVQLKRLMDVTGVPIEVLMGVA